jgi:hypothetical protein
LVAFHSRLLLAERVSGRLVCRQIAQKQPLATTPNIPHSRQAFVRKLPRSFAEFTGQTWGNHHAKYFPYRQDSLLLAILFDLNSTSPAPIGLKWLSMAQFGLDAQGYFHPPRHGWLHGRHFGQRAGAWGKAQREESLK